jgi:hypothetical protein
VYRNQYACNYYGTEANEINLDSLNECHSVKGNILILYVWDTHLKWCEMQFLICIQWTAKIETPNTLRNICYCIFTILKNKTM